MNIFVATDYGSPHDMVFASRPNYCSGGVQLDSILAAATSPSVYPSCTDLPDLSDLSSSDKTYSTYDGAFVVRTCQTALIVVDNTVYMYCVQQVAGITDCEDLLALIGRLRLCAV